MRRLLGQLRHPGLFLLAATVLAAAVTGVLAAWVVASTPIPTTVEIERVCPPGTPSYDPIDVRINGKSVRLGCNDPITTEGKASLR
jgi:hypothetical protein